MMSNSEDISDFVDAVKKTPDACEDKISAIKRLIASGQYRIDGSRIATNLLMESRENNEVLNQMEDRRTENPNQAKSVSMEDG